MRSLALVVFTGGLALVPSPDTAVAAEARAEYVIVAVGRDDDASSPQSLRRDPIVRRVQEMLAELGFYIGPLNGAMSDVTLAAIRASISGATGLRSTGSRIAPSWIT